MMSVFLICCLLYLWDSISHCIWNSTIQPDFLTNKSQGSFCPALSVPGLQEHTAVPGISLYKCRKSKPRSSFLHSKHFTKPTPLPCMCVVFLLPSTCLVCLPGCRAIGTDKMSLTEGDSTRVEFRDLYSNPTCLTLSQWLLSKHPLHYLWLKNGCGGMKAK